jgi:hypothetical protein
MEKKQARKEKSKLGNVEKTETKLLNVLLPKELIDRVNTFCTDKDITIQEFLTDAMIEKLRLAYKEKRKNPRL